MKKGIFVIGTGTDVGKTYVSGLIAKKIKESGSNIGYFKAAVSGNEYVNGELVPGDALWVKKTAGLTQNLEEMVPYIYEHAYSPHLAARIEGRPIHMELVKECFEACMEKHAFVLAEGSGGILCPLRFDTEEFWLEDVVKMTGFESVLVADAGLGTINSVILTYEYMKQKGLPIAGIILNHFEKDNLMHEDNRKMIEYKTKLPILACVGLGAQDIDLDLEKWFDL